MPPTTQIGPQTVHCLVNSVGPATGSAGHGETTDPVIYLFLTDTKGSFTNRGYYMPETARNEMLAVALAAVSTGFPVIAVLDQPPARLVQSMLKVVPACLALRVVAG